VAIDFARAIEYDGWGQQIRSNSTIIIVYQVTTVECSCINQAVNMSVTTLDYEKFIAGTPQERKQFAQDLLSSFERTGFAKMANHTFSTVQLQQLFHWVRNYR
jgi:hypothetical protein